MSVTHNSLRLFVAMQYFMYTFHIVSRMKCFISAWKRGSARVSMLAGGWEERGEGVSTSIFGVGESVTTPTPYFVFLYNSLHIINNCGRTDIIYLAI
jgi:hypothetical protein